MGRYGSRPRDDDDDDDDDRPRRRRRYDDDDDDDDDDRPRSRRRRRDDDYDDEPPPRRPRRKSRGPSTGKILGIIGGVLGIVAIVVVVILLVKGGIGGASISYAKFKEIKAGDTIEGLEKKFGKAKKLERAEWSKVQYAKEDNRFGGGRGGGGTLADLDPFGGGVDAWYHWHSGSEDIYVSTGKDFNGKHGLIMKVYTNSDALRENGRAGGDFSKMVPNFEVVPVN